jgi:hypothetical protein
MIPAVHMPAAKHTPEVAGWNLERKGIMLREGGDAVGNRHWGSGNQKYCFD